VPSLIALLCEYARVTCAISCRGCPRLTWSVTLVVCWLSCWAARSRWALPPRLRQRPLREPGWGVPFTLHLPYTVMMIFALVRDELRDNHHVRQRTSVDPKGRLSRSI
jgi:hypothetical protein